MDLTNKHVRHFQYGEGKVEAMQDASFRVLFDGDAGQKTFPYPSAFERFLTMTEEADQQAVLADLNAAQEQARKEQTKRDRIEAMKRHLTDSKRTAKKGAAKRKA